MLFIRQGEQAQGILIKNSQVSQAPVAHTYNPNYSGGRDPEYHGSKPAQENSLQDPISKNLSQK
jgi:hypothetical protein